MERSYTPLPFEYLEELDCLSDAEYGRLIRGLQMYGLTGEEPTLNGNEKAHWKRVRNRDDRYRESWDAEHGKKSEAGKKGASKRWQGNGKNSTAISANGKNSTAISANGKNGYTDTNTDTNTNTNTDNNDNKNTESCASLSFFLDRINPTPSPTCTSELLDFLKVLPDDVVLHALHIAVDERKTSWSYIKAILRNYKTDGLTDMDAVLRSEQEHERRGANAGDKSVHGDSKPAPQKWHIEYAVGGPDESESY